MCCSWITFQLWMRLVSWCIVTKTSIYSCEPYFSTLSISYMYGMNNYKALGITSLKKNFSAYTIWSFNCFLAYNPLVYVSIECDLQFQHYWSSAGNMCSFLCDHRWFGTSHHIQNHRLWSESHTAIQHLQWLIPYYYIAFQYLSQQNSAGMRNGIMVFLGVCVALPLGLCRNVESLSNISAISLGFYAVFVLNVSRGQMFLILLIFSPPSKCFVCWTEWCLHRSLPLLFPSCMKACGWAKSTGGFQQEFSNVCPYFPWHLPAKREDFSLPPWLLTYYGILICVLVLQAAVCDVWCSTWAFVKSYDPHCKKCYFYVHHGLFVSK